MSDKRHTILVVDDDRDLLGALRLVLEKHGYDMVGAGSAEDGIRAYQEKKPDLVIVDLMMEEVDSGTSFVKELKALGKTPPIYMLSSIGDGLHASIDCAELGLDGVLQKPLQTETLITTLRTKLK